MNITGRAFLHSFGSLRHSVFMTTPKYASFIRSTFSDREHMLWHMSNEVLRVNFLEAASSIQYINPPHERSPDPTNSQLRELEMRLRYVRRSEGEASAAPTQHVDCLDWHMHCVIQGRLLVGSLNLRMPRSFLCVISISLFN